MIIQFLLSCFPDQMGFCPTFDFIVVTDSKFPESEEHPHKPDWSKPKAGAKVGPLTGRGTVLGKCGALVTRKNAATSLSQTEGDGCLKKGQMECV